MNKEITHLPNEIVLASAGSGKTFRLSNRVIGLVMRGVEPRAIAALTFTKKAAGEFADAILTKLADAAEDESAASRLAADIGLPTATREDFLKALATVVDQLPQMFLGTLDSFFAKIVRCFQYELGLSGGAFEMIEGEAVQVLVEDLLGGILRGADLGEEERAEFLQAFKLSTLGKEESRVRASMLDFVSKWHGAILEEPRRELWGNWMRALPEGTTDASLQAKRVELQKQAELLFPKEKSVEALLEVTSVYVAGSGGFGESGLLAKILACWDELQSGRAEILFSRKTITFSEPATRVLRGLIETIAMQEALIKLVQTAAIWRVMNDYESRYEVSVRRNGRLTFDDLKLKMAAWSRSESERVRRELVDFRLDGRHDQWLLDEFQDTSRTQWLGVQSLIDEAVHADADEGRGLFVVGDKKQGIYAWRGGDPELFDVVMNRYSDIKPVPLADSWRSQPELLGVVNEVFGKPDVLGKLFPAGAVERWSWDEHVMAKEKARQSAYALVHQVDGRGATGTEERFEKVLSIIAEVEPVQRGLSCGILFRGKKEARLLAEQLREAGYPVAENGRYEPGKDNVVGRALVDLLRWLENPANEFAKVHLSMAGLMGENEEELWRELRTQATVVGWTQMVREQLAVKSLSAFGQKRLEKILEVMESAETAGVVTARELAVLVAGIELPTEDMAAALQVMTIHKSKGLGFDMVILPEVEDDVVVNFQNYTLGRLGEGEESAVLTQVPPKWARACLPAYAGAESEWAETQCYEALCVLYVAMTRAKRGLYVLLDAPKKGEEDKASLAGLVRTALPETDDATLYEAGESAWFAGEKVVSAAVISLLPELPPLEKRQGRSQASHRAVGAMSAEEMDRLALGSELHRLFEEIEWVIPKMPQTEAGQLATAALGNDEVRAVFEIPGGDVECLREQGFEVLMDGVWVSGSIDRMHLFREAGVVTKIDLFDFKTDRVTSAGELKSKHSRQLQVYCRAMAQVFALDEGQVRAVLVSTFLPAVIS